MQPHKAYSIRLKKSLMKGNFRLTICFFVFLFADLSSKGQSYLHLEEVNLINFEKKFSYLHSAELSNSDKVYVELTYPLRPAICIVNTDSITLTPVLALKDISTFRKSGELVGMFQTSKTGGFINLFDDYFELRYLEDGIYISDLEDKNLTGSIKTIIIKRIGKKLKLNTNLEALPTAMIPIIMNFDLNHRIKYVTPEVMKKISPIMNVLSIMSNVNRLR